MKAGIIGGGIGGLVTAIGLQRAGADVQVFERRATVDQPGSGLSLFGNGFAALDAVSLGDTVRAFAGEGPLDIAYGQRRRDGRWLSRLSPGAIDRLRIVHRSDLHEALVGALAPSTLRTGTPVRATTPEGRVTLETDGREVTEDFDVVVAADGIRSRVRASWPGDPGIRYSGYSAWRGVTSTPVDLRGAAGESWGAGLRFGLAPLRDGRVYWFGVATMPAETEYADEYAAVSGLFAGWHEPIEDVMAGTRPTDVHRLPIEDLAGPLATFRRGRCVLLGDAAHAMTPDLGQGANQAMEDAATLAGLLAPLAGADDPDPELVDQALTTYDVERRRRTQPIARRAYAVGKVAQARGPVRVRLRDALIRAVPDRAAARQVVALQKWSAPVAPVTRAGVIS